MYRPGSGLGAGSRLSLPLLILTTTILLPRSMAQYSHNHNGTSNSSSSNNNNGISIPTSTIVYIGAGFIAFAFSIVLLLFILRLKRVRKLARSNGQSFAVAWEQDGGFWGFLNAIGGESSILGAGGSHALRTRRIRIENSRENWKTPDLWESDWIDHKIDHEDMSCLQPLAVVPSKHPNSTSYNPSSILPSINLSILIALPCPEAPLDPEQLPDLIIGTTTLLPTISADPALSQRPSIESGSEYKSGGKGQIEQIEYVSGLKGGAHVGHHGVDGDEGTRRARWEQSRGGQWHIESLG